MFRIGEAACDGSRGFPISKKSHFISSARLIAVLTLCSRVLGMVRDGVCSRFFGAAVLDYYYIAFQIPNLFRRLFGEGALSAALIPIYTELQNEDSHSAHHFVRSVVTVLVIVLSAGTILGLSAIFLIAQWIPESDSNKHLMLNLMAIMLPFMVLICTVAVIGGILNVHHHFGSIAAAPIILNICIITAVLQFRHFFGETVWQQIYAAAWAVLVAGCLQLAIQIPFLRKSGIPLLPCFQFRHQAMKKMLVLMGPMVIGLAAVQINTLLDSVLAKTLSSTSKSGSTFTLAAFTVHYPVSQGAVTYLYYAQRFYQFPLGVFGVALATAIFPVLSRYAYQKDLTQFSQTFNQGIRLVIFLALPMTLGMILVKKPLVYFILKGGKYTLADCDATTRALLFYSLGISFYFLQQLVVRAYYSFKDSATPVKIALRMIGLNLVLNLVLIWPLGVGGLALSTAICAAIQVFVLLRILFKRYELSIEQGLARCFIKTVIASIGMTLAGYTILAFLSDFHPVIQLAGVVPTCTLTFIGLAGVFKIPELRMVLSRHTINEET